MKEYRISVLPPCPKCGGHVTEIWRIVDFSMDDHVEYICPLCLKKWRTL